MKPALAGFLILSLSAAALADVKVDLRYGHGGRAVAGALTQVVVRVTSRESEPLTLRITGGVPERILPGEVSRVEGYLAPGGEKDFTLFVRPPEQGYVDLELSFDRAVAVDAGGRTLRSPARIHALSSRKENPAFEEDAPAHLQLLAVGRQAGSLPETERVRVMPVSANDLPDLWHALDSLDAVYWRNPSDAKELSPARLTALLRWVRLGGRLVISETRRVDLLTEGVLADSLPATPVVVRTHQDYVPIAKTLAGGGIGRDDGSFANVGPITRMTVRDGSERLPSDAGPLMVEVRRGLGTIVLLSFDPARFEGAKGALASGIYMTLVGEGPYIDSAKLDEGIEFPAFGEYDTNSTDYFSAILRSLRIGAVKPPPMALLSLFMLLYILAVGPGDYFLLKRKKLLKYSALSFLALAILFSATAYFVSFHLFSGGSRVNRITLVDIVPEGDGEAVLIHDFTGFYAPRGGSLELSVAGDTTAFSQLLRPRDFSGGGGGIATDPLRLDLAAPARPTGEISIPFRSLRTVRTVAYRSSVLPLDASFDARGALRATNGFPFRLRDAALFGPDGIQHIGGLDPGEAIDIVFNPKPPSGDTFRHSGGRHLPDASKLVVDVDDTDDLTVAQKGTIARSFLALSVAGALDPQGRELYMSQRRLLEKWGIDRSPAIERGAVVLLAWTDERDPFSLPGGEDEGFSVTVLRKVVER